jgi:hypothetical protein
MVSGAVAGGDLHGIARSASDALGLAVAIALPALGETVVWPPHAADPGTLSSVTAAVAAAIRGQSGATDGIADCVPVQIGTDVAGIVAALGTGGFDPVQRPWLEAAAAAAAVAALMRDAANDDLEIARQEFVETLAARPVQDPASVVASGRRLGVDLSAGAVAVCAQRPADGTPLPGPPGALLVELAGGRVLGLLPAAAGDAGAEAVAAALSASGAGVALSAPRRHPAALHGALREAQLLLKLASGADAMLAGQEGTYRLLIGILLHDPDELEQLRASTVSPLERYDAEHDTELLATLQAFLAHHGSTTETAEAMSLHRHTVGYRLARVHEVSGLSPYESDGRERLSLGLKAHQILEADRARPDAAGGSMAQPARHRPAPPDPDPAPGPGAE